MKTGAIIRTGVAGGLLAAATVGTAGTMLGFTIPPWNWSSLESGQLRYLLQWLWAITALMPVGAVLGTVLSVVCALVFEFVTHRAGRLLGCTLGLLIGSAGAAFAGLVPWMAAAYGYAYMPASAPFGFHDPSWPFVIVLGTGVLMGSVAGGGYGKPLHGGRRARPLRWRQVYASPESLRPRR